MDYSIWGCKASFMTVTKYSTKNVDFGDSLKLSLAM